MYNVRFRFIKYCIIFHFKMQLKEIFCKIVSIFFTAFLLIRVEEENIENCFSFSAYRDENVGQSKMFARFVKGLLAESYHNIHSIT